MTLPLELRRWKVEAPAAYEEWEERAAFIEWLAKRPRDTAEREAEEIVRRSYANSTLRGRSGSPRCTHPGGADPVSP